MTDPADPGDYGYDEAHDATDGGRGAGHRTPDPDPAHPHRAADRPDPDGDFGYDEAHGF
jgi:hypothetical protein